MVVPMRRGRELSGFGEIRGVARNAGLQSALSSIAYKAENDPTGMITHQSYAVREGC